MGILSKFLIIIYLLVPGLLSAGNPNTIAQGVFDRLYQVNGHFNPQKPKLEIIKGTKNVALYIKSKNTIQVEEQAYQLCRTFGKDSLDALAFILGHELIHAIQINNVLPKTSFISYDKNLKSSLQIEQNADVQGIFVCYLAGFKTMQLIPQLIDKMYTVYGLRSKNIKGYPTETERKASSKSVIEQANVLIELFNLANQMSVIEEYKTSIQCLEYISKFYQGKEIYNNLGINYALMALNSTTKNVESFIYPLELDWNTRIKKPKAGRGDEDLDPIEKIGQLQKFIKAKDNFLLAAEMDPNYMLADLNVFSVLIMMDDLQSAKEFYSKELKRISEKPLQGDLFLKIKLAHAILLAKMKNFAEANKIWEELSKNKKTIIANQAQQNLFYIRQNKPLWNEKPEISCSGVAPKGIADAGIKLRNVETEDWIKLDSFHTIGKKHLNNSEFYSFEENDRRIVIIQKIPIQSNIKLDVNDKQTYSLGNNQWIYQCKTDHSAYILNERDEIVYLIRYQHFREIEE